MEFQKEKRNKSQMRQLQYAKPKLWIKAGMLKKMMLKIPFKITVNNFQKRCADLFLRKKRIFTVITYHTPILSESSRKEKILKKCYIVMTNSWHVFCMISVLTCSLSQAIHTIPDNSCADTKTIPDRAWASIHT